jgi:hypothetical protein
LFLIIDICAFFPHNGISGWCRLVTYNQPEFLISTAAAPSFPPNPQVDGSNRLKEQVLYRLKGSRDLTPKCQLHML